ncbi:hypothetical protein KJZ99_00100 [bacterium]|nr:hypothetical protein [bacterium]
MKETISAVLRRIASSGEREFVPESVSRAGMELVFRVKPVSAADQMAIRQYTSERPLTTITEVEEQEMQKEKGGLPPDRRVRVFHEFADAEYAIGSFKIRRLIRPPAELSELWEWGPPSGNEYVYQDRSGDPFEEMTSELRKELLFRVEQSLQGSSLFDKVVPAEVEEAVGKS